MLRIIHGADVTVEKFIKSNSSFLYSFIQPRIERGFLLL